MKPVFTIDGYVVTFSALPEDQPMRQHFMKECGWTEADYRKIKDFDWFTAEVKLWKDGEELASDYLGACCYKSEDDFWTAYKGDYFADTVHAVLTEAGRADLADQARAELRADRPQAA